MSYHTAFRFLRATLCVAALSYGFLLILSVHEVSAADDARAAAAGAP
jgi:hypothetical protein